MADFCYIPEMPSKAHFGLGNRCSVQLSYGGRLDFPRFVGFAGQCETRETRKSLRFARAHQGAQSVLPVFSRLSSSRSTASRMKSDRFSLPVSRASMRASVPARKRPGVCSSLILGRPTLGRISDITFSAKPCILLISPIDRVRDITYLDDIRYGGK